MKLNGLVAVVTGAAGGIGKAIAKRLAADGARVVLADIQFGPAQAAAGEIVAAGGEALAVAVDITNNEAVVAMAQAAIERFGKIDILVNNAGITRDAMYHKMTEEQFDQVISVHLKGAWLCGRAVIGPMRERRSGKIVNISSISGKQGNPGQTNYSAAKAGLIGYTKATAKELGRYNINVNAIMPGVIDTPMLASVPAETKEGWITGIPLQRIGQPEDIAAAVSFLVSDDAAYITGAVLEVSGGRAM